MKKGISFILTIIILLLSSCSTETMKLNYDVLDDTVNGYNVVHVTVDKSTAAFCGTFDYEYIEVDDNTQIRFRYDYNKTGYFLRIDDEYMEFDDAVKNDYVTPLDVLNSGYGEIIYTDSINNFLGLNLDSFFITNVIVHELNNELALSGSGEWDASYTLTLDISEIIEHFQSLVSVKIEESDMCKDTTCILYKAQAPFQLDLESPTYKLKIQVYEDYVDLFFTQGEEMYYIYHVSDDNAELLFKYLSTLHNESNK